MEPKHLSTGDARLTLPHADAGVVKTIISTHWHRSHQQTQPWRHQHRQSHEDIVNTDTGVMTIDQRLLLFLFSKYYLHTFQEHMLHNSRCTVYKRDNFFRTKYLMTGETSSRLPTLSRHSSKKRSSVQGLLSMRLWLCSILAWCCRSYLWFVLFCSGDVSTHMYGEGLLYSDLIVLPDILY